MFQGLFDYASKRDWFDITGQFCPSRSSMAGERRQCQRCVKNTAGSGDRVAMCALKDIY